MDRLHAKGYIENLVRSLSRFSEKTLLILSDKSDVNASAKKIGPSLIVERLWKELGIKKVIRNLLVGRKIKFDVEREFFSPSCTGFLFPAPIVPAIRGTVITLSVM